MATPSFRGRILEPYQGYEPRSLWEIALRAGIGAILSKRQWWIKWQDTSRDVREKWLAEFEETWMRQTLHWTAMHWNVWGIEGAVFRKYQAFPPNATLEEKRRVVHDACSTIDYALIWTYREDEDDEDDDTTAATDESLEAFRSANAKMDAYGQLLWYVRLALLNREFTQHDDPNQWPTANTFEMSTPETEAQVVLLLQQVRKGNVLKDTLGDWLQGADVRPHVLDALWVHVDRILQQLEELRGCISRTLDAIIHANSLDQPGQTLLVSDGPVAETWMSDAIIDPALKARFLAGIAQLEDVPDDQKDWHPGSNQQVLNLIHPSLYCCAFGQTKRVANPAAVADAAGDVIEQMHRICFSADQLVEDPGHTGVKFQWIPSNFAVDADGHVKILSYINNLHPVDHPDMYATIAAVFERFVPLFDRVLTSLANPAPSGEMMIPDLYDRDTSEIPKRPPIPDVLLMQPTCTTAFTLKGRKVQVIVKIAEILLTPERPSYDGGAWHIEGTPAEHIVTTGLYYFASENISESRLSFRVIVQEPDYQQDDGLGMATMYGLQRDALLMQYLGSAVALEDRCLVFPNTFQHKVEPFHLADPTRPGKRKILAFFVVDPSKSIPSTAEIPPQQESWLQQAQNHVLRKLGRLPEAVIEKHLESMLNNGMSLAQASANRLALMEERRPVPDDELDSDLQFSLCEH